MKAFVQIIGDYRSCRVLALGWMAMIFWLSSLPDIPGPDLFSAQDKLEHLLVFGVLGFLFARSLGPRREKLWQWQVAVVTLMVAVYGAVDEIHQSFVIGRDASLSDFLFDTLGGFIFALLSYRSVLFSRKRP